MNTKRLLLSILVLFVANFFMNFLIHGLWLQSTYKETMSLWRSEPEMQARFVWMLLGQFVFSSTFACIWAAGFAEKRCAGCACAFGVLMALFSQSISIINYVVMPLPPSLVAKWVVAGLVHGVLLGLLAFSVYKPKPAESKSTQQPAAAAAV
jgi:hypothetical protein